MGIDGPVVAEEVITPNVLKELVPGQSDIFVFYEIEQEVIFFWRQLDFFPVHGYAASRRVDGETAECENLRKIVFCRGFVRLRTALTRAISSLGLNGLVT